MFTIYKTCPENRLEVERNTTFLTVSADDFQEQRYIRKASSVFLVGMFLTEIRVPFLQGHLCIFEYHFQAFATFLRQMELIELI